jgi:poly-D-alanine transfer protein DltD
MSSREGGLAIAVTFAPTFYPFPGDRSSKRMTQAHPATAAAYPMNQKYHLWLLGASSSPVISIKRGISHSKQIRGVERF